MARITARGARCWRALAASAAMLGATPRARAIDGNTIRFGLAVPVELARSAGEHRRARTTDVTRQMFDTLIDPP